MGHGFERAGDLSTADSCLYYKRAVKALEEEKPFIQADSYTLDGKTFRLEPLRQENDKALERVKLKFRQRRLQVGTKTSDQGLGLLSRSAVAEA